MAKKLKLQLENEGQILIRPRDKKHPEDFVALFRERSDEDWEFVMMVATGDTTFPDLTQSESGDQGLALLMTVAKAVNDAHYRALILYLGDPDCPTIYEMHVDEEGNVG